MTALNIPFTLSAQESRIISLDRWGFPQYSIMLTEGNGELDVEWTLQKPNRKDIYPAVPASGFYGQATNPIAAETVTIGSFVYTFVVAPTVAFDVDIGGSAAASMANLIAAINLTGTEGVEYGAGTTINTDVSAIEGSPAVSLVATAKEGGTTPVVAVATTVTDGAWDDVEGGSSITELEGGVDAGSFETRAVWTLAHGSQDGGGTIDTLEDLAAPVVSSISEMPIEALRITAKNASVAGIVSQTGAT